MKILLPLSLFHFSPAQETDYNLEEEVEDLHPRYDGEACQQPHGSFNILFLKIFLCFPLTSNSGEHVLELGPLVFGDLVECWSVEVDPDHF